MCAILLPFSNYSFLTKKKKKKKVGGLIHPQGNLKTLLLVNSLPTLFPKWFFGFLLSVLILEGLSFFLIHDYVII